MRVFIITGTEAQRASFSKQFFFITAYRDKSTLVSTDLDEILHDRRSESPSGYALVSRDEAINIEDYIRHFPKGLTIVPNLGIFAGVAEVQAYIRALI